MLKSNTISLKIYYNITLYIQFKDTMIFIYYNVTIKTPNAETESPAGLQKKFPKKPKFEPNHHNCKFRFIFCSLF